jgi:hypothetical protein
MIGLQTQDEGARDLRNDVKMLRYSTVNALLSYS